MTNKLQQTIKDELEKLPKENQKAISSVDWVKIAEEVGKKYLLTDTEINNLQVETLLILTGIEDFDSYARNIEREIGLSKEEAEKISQEVIEKIFDPISGKIPSEESHSLEQSTGAELDERFNVLSDEIKNIIAKSNYYTKLYAIAEKNKLNVPQMGTLEETVTGVMIGSIHPDDFEKMLIKNLGLPEGIVREIADEVNNQILKPIRAQMEKFYNKPKSGSYEIKPQINNKANAPAGIRIIHPSTETKKPEIDTMELKEGNPAIDQKMQPVLEQKLADSYKASTVKTDHSIENITKDKSASSSAPKAYPPKGDPYREIPE